MNRVLVEDGEGLDQLWRSEADRTVLQCYCSTKTRGRPGKRTNHGDLAGAHLHLSGSNRMQPQHNSHQRAFVCSIYLVPLCSWQNMLLATCELGRASMVIASRIDTAGRANFRILTFHIWLCAKTQRQEQEG